jgi:hypothetical protein
MLSALALYLLTEPRVLRDQNESAWSLRRRARWVGLLGLGGFGGLLLSGFDPTISYRGAVSINLFAIGVCCCELPANALLYLYLRDLSRRLTDRRATMGLGVCVLAVPALSFIAVLLLALGSLERSALSTAWRLSIMVYGAAALAAGVIGTTAVVRLAWVVTVAAFGGWIAATHGASARLPHLLRQSVAAVDHHWPRWCAIIGLILWLCSVPLCIQNVLFTPTRFGLGGGVPLLNFAGPKVSSYSLVTAAAIRGDSDDQSQGPLPIQTQLSADALTLVAVWLVTCLMPGLDPSPKWRWAARWGILAMVSASLGVVLARNDLESLSPSHFTAWAVLTTEAPATFIVYTYLAHLATGLGDAALARKLRRIAWAAAFLAITPLPAFALSRPLHDWRASWIAAGLAAAYVTVSLAVSLMAGCALTRLVWRLAANTIAPQRSAQQAELGA